MAIKIPGGNPFVDVQVGSTQEMGLQSAKEGEWSERKQFEGLSGTFGKAMEDYQKSIDETVTRDNMLALNDAVDDILNNKETGLLNRKGKDATTTKNGMSLQDQAMDELKRRYDDIAKGAYNKRQREAFGKFYGSVAASVQQKTAAHVIKQQAVFEADVHRREMDKALKDMLSGDPELIKSGEAALRVLTQEMASKNGLEVDYTETIGKAQAMRVSALLDADDVEGAKALLQEAKGDMSAADLHRCQRLVSMAEKRKAKANGIANAQQIMESQFSDFGVTRNVVKEATGKNVSESDYQLALEKAGGDAKLAAQIVTVGVDKWDSATLEEKATAGHVGEMFHIRSNDFSKKSAEDLVPEVMKLNPKLGYEDAVEVSRNLVAKRASIAKEAQTKRDDAAKMAFGYVQQGGRVADIPVGADVSDALRQDLGVYATRKATNSLVTDPAKYWDLTTNPEELKTMSDESFVRLAKDFSPEGYAELAKVRAGLRSGHYVPQKEEQLQKMMADAIEQYGIAIPSDQNGKLVRGFVLELLSKDMAREQVLRGTPFTQEEVGKRVKTFLNTTFTQKDAGWFMRDIAITGEAFVKGKTAELDSDINALLNIGIEAQGMFDATDVSRTRLMLGIACTPKAPIPGVDKMYEHLSYKKPAYVRSIEGDWKKVYGRAPTKQEVVQAVFNQYFSN